MKPAINLYAGPEFHFNFIKKLFKYLFLSTFIVTINHSCLFSQRYFNLTGKVRDISTKEVLPFTNISLGKDSIGTIADENGVFVLTLKPDKYIVTASYVGYKTMMLPIDISKRDTNISINMTPTDCLLQTVTVYSSGSLKDENEKLSNISLQSERIAEMSSVFRDVFRSLQSLPGISANNELSAKFNVRGGNFDENLVLVNSAQVYEPFHIKEATYASVGIFNVDLMKKVDIITGGFSAEYGDKMSSVLNIEYREGIRERIKASASFSLVGLDLITEGPLTNNGSFLIGFRKSYFEYLMSYFTVDDRIHPSLYDLQGVISYHLSPKNKILFQFIHSGDNFHLDPDFQNQTNNYQQIYKNRLSNFKHNNNTYNEEKAHYNSNLFDIQSINLITGDAILKFGVSYYSQYDNESRLDTTHNRTDIYSNINYFSDYRRERKYENILRIKTIEGKVQLEFKAADFHEIKLGFNYQNILYTQDLLDYDTRITLNNTEKYPDTSRTIINAGQNDEAYESIETQSFKFSSYMENILQINERMIINIGGRLDYFDFNKDFVVSPRISFSYRSGIGLTFRGAWGYYYQSPNYSQLLYSFTADSNTKSQKAIHFILGAEQTFPIGRENNNINIKIEAYYKKYDDLISSSRSSYWRINYSKRNDASGFARGIDVFATLSLTWFYGWMSYGLLQAKEDILNDKIPEYPRYTDQRHTASIVTDFDLGKYWSLNLRVFYGSGYAHTPYYSKYNNSAKKWEWISGDRNSDYLPGYYRVDARISKTFSIDNFSFLAFLDVTNLFNFKNIMSFRYTFNNDGTPKREEIKLFPIIPSIGLTINY